MYILIDKNEFIDLLGKMKKEKKIRIFYDIETYQYNEDMGKENPSMYKNCIYSLAISLFFEDKLYISLFSNFKDFFDCFSGVFNNKKKPTIELIAHNGNKYDNHFLRYDLIYYYDLPYTNQYLLNSKDEGNLYSVKIKEISKEEKEKGIILEKRVKSRNNLEMTIYLFGVKFTTLDNYIKTHSSIATLGKKLKRIGVLTDEELKTDYDYLQYNKSYDMTEEQARNYSLNIFNNLTESELKYIRNDVIILAYSYKYYSEIYKGFDYEKITFTRNILDSYNINPITNYQLLKTHGFGKSKMTIEYTKFKFNNCNFYDYLKSFYNGGLNFYNDNYLGKIIDTPVFGMDINSSYPSVMYKEKIPTYLDDYEEYNKPTFISVKEIESVPDTYTLYRMTREHFDYYIISRIKSRVIKQILVKYYNKNEFININSYTFKLIKELTDIEIDKIPVLSWIRWECLYFGAREIIEKFYRIKTQGKHEYKLDMEDITDIKETKEKSNYVYSREEVDISKLNLNGLYGIPALRPYFNLFRWYGHELKNVENGFINSHRNIVFSTFVTSVSVYNLLYPLKYFTHKEIDEGFLYCDTDSLYFKKELAEKIPKSLFHPDNIGAWDVQNECIDKFYILNHKKYAYEENGEITVKAGGVPQQAFNTNMSFEDFINTQFKEGTEIKNVRSIFNKQGTISIYPAITKLDLGFPYPIYSYDETYIEKKEEMFKAIKEQLSGEEDDTLYIESNIGTFSISEIYPVKHNPESLDLTYYKHKEEFLKSLINNY